MHENIMNIPAVTALCYDTATFTPCTHAARFFDPGPASCYNSLFV